MLLIEQYVHSNRLVNVHPLEKFIVALATMTVCLASRTILAPFIALLLMSGILLLGAGIPSRFYFYLMLLPFSFLLMGIVPIIFSIAESASGFLFSFSLGFWVIGVTHTALLQGVHLFAKSLGAVSCLYFLALTTPMVEIISVLRKLKVPALFTELMSLVYRFVFVLLETAASIHTAQSARLGHVNWKASMRSTSQLFYALFIRSFVRSQALATALEARCYRGEIRVLERTYPVSKFNYALAAALELFLIALNII